MGRAPNQGPPPPAVGESGVQAVSARITTEHHSLLPSFLFFPPSCSLLNSDVVMHFVFCVTLVGRFLLYASQS
eukprot:2142493-Pyramimonas_sp.AAC.1